MAAPAETGSATRNKLATRTQSNTLAVLAKRKAADKEAAPRRGRWIHHVGEDTVDESLEVYYCAYCGAHSLILDVLVSELPCRQSDRSRVVALAKHATQLLLDEGPCVKLKRGAGLVEKQYRYLCKGCGLPLAYLSHPFKDSANKFLYLIENAFALTADGKSLAQLEAEERAKSAEVPIVIPVFNVKKSAGEAPASAAAAAAASSASSSASSAAAPASSSAAAAAAAPASSAGADATPASSAGTAAADQSKA